MIRYKKIQEQHAREKAFLEAEKIFEVTKAQLEISEDIMKSISINIHDNIGQLLSLAKISVKAINEENVKSQTEHTTEIITRAINDLRHLSKSLNGNFIRENGLIDSIQRELNSIQAAGKINCELIDETHETRISENNEVILFRCVQESLNNIIKHAEADHIKIGVSSIHDMLQISVADNGKGISADIIEKSKDGLGLRSMKERMKLVQGEFVLNTSSQTGTQIIFRVPFNPKNQS